MSPKLTTDLPPPGQRTRRDHIGVAVSDMMAEFLYYDRKEDDSLELDSIEDAIIAGEVSIDEIVEVVRAELVNAVLARKFVLSV